MGTLWKSVLAVLLLLVVPIAARSAAPPAVSGADTAKTGTINGQLLTSGGEPLAGGMVYFFSRTIGPPPAHDKYWRVPEIKKRLDNEGRFSIVLPEGEYYISSTKKFSVKEIGPPREGDYYFISTDNNGIPINYSVRNNVQVDLGKIAGAAPFRSSSVNYGNGISSIGGVVLDNAREPVAGAFVIASISAAKGVRPLFIAEPTGKDGSFILRVQDAGTYYLKVRSVFGGGPPLPGEMIGMYGDKQPEPITVKKGEKLTGFTIKVTNFAGRGLQKGAK